MSAPKISIVIVNWNGIAFLKDCLESVHRQNYPYFEVIVVDNGSTDNSVTYIKAAFPKTIIIESKKNYGFAVGNNRGIKVAKGKYIVTLNNDTKLADDCITKLIHSAEDSEGSIGMWAPKILSMQDPHLIDSVGGLIIYPDCIAKGRGRLEKDMGQYDGLKEVLIPSACAALYRRKMLDQIGLFDEAFFSYCEDTDLGLRAKLFGWRTLSVPEAVIYHYYSGTAGKYTPFKAYLVERNHIWVALKNLPLRYLLLTPFYTIWRYIIQAYGITVAKGAGGKFTEESSSTKLLFILLRAYLGSVRKLPSMLFKRKHIQRMRTVPIKEFGECLKRYRLSAAELVLKD